MISIGDDVVFVCGADATLTKHPAFLSRASYLINTIYSNAGPVGQVGHISFDCCKLGEIYRSAAHYRSS